MLASAGTQDFVIHAAGLRIGPGQQMRLDLHAIAHESVIHFNFVRSENCADRDNIAGGWLH